MSEPTTLEESLYTNIYEDSRYRCERALATSHPGTRIYARGQEVREADEEVQRVESELKPWYEERMNLNQQIEDQINAIEGCDKSDVQKIREMLDATNEMQKQQQLGTPRDHDMEMRWSHAILRMHRALSDHTDARMDCLSPGQEEYMQILSECGEGSRRALAKISKEMAYGKTREEWARQYELLQNESSTASPKKEGQNEVQGAEQSGGQVKGQDGGPIDGRAEDLVEGKDGGNDGGNGEAHIVDHTEDHVEGRDGGQIHNHGAAHAEDHGEAHISDHGGQGENQ